MSPWTPEREALVEQREATPHLAGYRLAEDVEDLRDAVAELRRLRERVGALEAERAAVVAELRLRARGDNLSRVLGLPPRRVAQLILAEAADVVERGGR